MKKIFKWYLLEEEDIKNIIGRGNKHEARLQRLEKRENDIETLLDEVIVTILNINGN